MRSPLAPLHLLPLAEAFAHHLIHGGLHEPCGNGLAVAISLPIIRDQVAVVRDVGAEFFHRFAQLFKLRVGLFEVVDERLEVLDLVLPHADSLKDTPHTTVHS
jgi:hypothetical protein